MHKLTLYLSGPLSFSRFYTVSNPTDSWTAPFPVDPAYSLSLLSQQEHHGEREERSLPKALLNSPMTVRSTNSEDSPYLSREELLPHEDSLPDPSIERPSLKIDTNPPTIQVISPPSSETSVTIDGLSPASPNQNSDSEPEGQVLTPVILEPLVGGMEDLSQNASQEIFDPFLFQDVQADPNNLDQFYSALQIVMDPKAYPTSAPMLRSPLTDHGPLSYDPVQTYDCTTLFQSYSPANTNSTFSIPSSPVLRTSVVPSHRPGSHQQAATYLLHPLQRRQQPLTPLSSLAELHLTAPPDPAFVHGIPPAPSSPSPSADLLRSVLVDWRQKALPLTYPMLQGSFQWEVDSVAQELLTPDVERDASGTPPNGCQEAILATSSESDGFLLGFLQFTASHGSCSQWQMSSVCATCSLFQPRKISCSY